ncbi:hypothetical protein [Paracoccus thiocyanatus]|uniref:Uncharacterized protein n=1 Tax=Paracoccus thiocyanatus TaxID=34006 RepID=A0A3D8PGS4_9RHOB|nr:hypothetical protein [Paracoccus thiocyanatus]RDW14441.1 hypothetical protein DIE28_02750 [Paracoccus thiocyanatus]
MTENEPGLLQQTLFFMAMIGAWIAGEAGRAALAGAAGGLVRWLMSERRRIRDGVVSVIAGALMARYASPVMLALLERWLGEMSGDVGGAAGFAAGLAGMSLAKLTLAILDANYRRITGGGQSDA